jgi:hypothetical protein
MEEADKKAYEKELPMTRLAEEEHSKYDDEDA